jgi:hypothetical protein
MRYGWDDRNSIPGWGRYFFLRHCFQIGSGAHPASCPRDTGVLSPEVKRPKYEADSSSPSTAEVKNTWSYTSTPPYVFKV